MRSRIFMAFWGAWFVWFIKVWHDRDIKTNAVQHLHSMYSRCVYVVSTNLKYALGCRQLLKNSQSSAERGWQPSLEVETRLQPWRRWELQASWATFQLVGVLVWSCWKAKSYRVSSLLMRPYLSPCRWWIIIRFDFFFLPLQLNA